VKGLQRKLDGKMMSFFISSFIGKAQFWPASNLASLYF